MMTEDTRSNYSSRAKIYLRQNAFPHRIVELLNSLLHSDVHFGECNGRCRSNAYVFMCARMRTKPAKEMYVAYTRQR